jgi:nucleotide-binding universal stress UspA family protein
MLKRLLVPLDGSRFAELAVPVAIELARRTGGEVRLLMVHEPTPVTVPVPAGPILLEPDDDTRRELQRSYLGDFARGLARDGSPSVTWELLDGRAGPALSDAASTWDADLLVMTTHGRGPLSRLWLGSVADYVVRHATRPVLLIHPRDAVDWPQPDLGVRTVLVPTDFSVESEAVLETAVALAKAYRAGIELVHVLVPSFAGSPLLPYPIPTSPELVELERATAEDALQAVAARLRAAGAEVETQLLYGPTVASALLELLKQDSSRMVAIATHGLGGIQRAVLGSVADKVIRGSHRPVLVVRPTKP